MMRWDDEQYLSKDRMDSKKVRLILFRLTGGARLVSDEVLGGSRVVGNEIYRSEDIAMD